jgi:hypothetical protein
MANIDAAFGLRPYRMLGSGANTNGTMKFKLQTASEAGTSSVIYQGSPVIPLGTGLINIVGNANGGTVPLLGAFLGCEYVTLDGTPTWSPKWPGTAAAKSGSVAIAHVAADPNQLFLINCDAAIADATIHANANFGTATSGNATTGISTAELAASTANTTDTLNMRIIGFEDTPANADAAVAGRLAIVLLNNHFYRYSTNGTGLGI